MVAKIRSLGLQGIGGYEVSAEIYLDRGLPQFDVVGLPDAAVREARERVRASIKSCGLEFPVSRLTANLAPADRRKAGTVYDLPILLGILLASGQVKQIPPDAAFIGELSLSGELRPVRGALPMALAAEKAGIRSLFVPELNAREAAYADGLAVYGVRDIPTLLLHLSGEAPLAPEPCPQTEPEELVFPDFAQVKGQENVKRALEVAAAGGHNVLMVGPPGSGKSMLSKRLPSILPEMSREETLESTGIWSVCGLTDARHPVLRQRPFRAPHHTLSAAAMAGGAQLQPGEVSLAHNGVLFLDELPEYRRDVLEVMRQPLEDGVVTVSRAAGTAVYPSRFMLVCAMNPCPCGWYGQPGGRCRCSEKAVRAYHQKLSGPLLDRIDIIVEVPALPYEDLRRRPDGEDSAVIRQRVNAARSIQRQRFGPRVSCNAQMGPGEMEQFCSLTPEGEGLMRDAFASLGLTARSYDRILRVARTIADLAGEREIAPMHLAEAIQYRTYDLSLDAGEVRA
ncbi:MAG: YifB family Mg chelatase-like AAA ATPase [Oscillospiraceae bacterium]|nr:YifB family Mg chelatase-like AAA ATPase [Oscillospiraceae bacterium]